MNIGDLPDKLAHQFAESTSGCWEWQAGGDSDGYGRVRYDGRIYRVHRLVYQLLVGDIPEGFVIDHVCRNPSCSNPDHLEAVTQGENVRRGNATDQNPWAWAAQMADAGVHAIDIARQLGVPVSTVRQWVC